MPLKKIMIVEDESIIAKNIQIMVNRLGYQVIGIESTGEGAVKKAISTLPDLILMDIILKGEMDGIEAAEKIQHHFNIPIVYLTAYADNDTLTRAKITGPYGYITKPFEVKELHSTIEMAFFRHEMEQKLIESEERFKILFEFAPDAFYLCDLKGTFIDGNKAAEKTVGYKKEELIGSSFLKLKLIPPKQILKAAKLLRENAKKKPTGPDEFTITRKDRKKVEVEISTYPVSIKDETLVLGIARDITPRKKAEKALRESEIKYRTLFNCVTDPVFIFNKKTKKILDCNQTAIQKYGYTLDELKKMTPLSFHPENEVKTAENNIKKLNNNKSNPPHYYTHITKKGKKIFVETLTSSIKYQGQSAWLSVIRDITERKKAEKKLIKTTTELKRHVADLEQFAYISSHDLQEPLRMIASYVELLKKRYIDKLDTEALEFIDFAVEGANRMKKLLNDLLTYSRLNIRGKPFTLTDSAKIVKETIENMKSCIDKNNATIIFDQLPKVWVDPTQFRELLQYLLDNAIKFRRIEKPQIQIHAKQQKQYWLFSVKDNGIGIDSQYFEKIFKIFQRLHSQGEYSGTGVGLAICKKIVERHNGQIWVESKPGKGSTFFFTIPQTTDQNPADNATSNTGKQ